MLSEYERITQEYETLLTLKKEFYLKLGKAIETGDLLEVEELKVKLEQQLNVFAENLGRFKWNIFDRRLLSSVKKKENYCVYETLEGHTGWVLTLQVLPDGRIVSGSSDGTIKIWEKGASGKYEVKETLKGHTGCVNTLQVLPDGRIVSGSNDGTIKVWEKGASGKYEVKETLKGHTGWVNTLQVLPDGRIVSGSGDGTIKIWDGK